MNYLRRAALVVLTVGFFIVAMSAVAGLLWALVDAKQANKTLGSNFAIVGVSEALIALYALGRGITHFLRSGKDSYDRPDYLSHSFRK
jgi:hypothetical protein